MTAHHGMLRTLIHIAHANLPVLFIEETRDATIMRIGTCLLDPQTRYWCSRPRNHPPPDPRIHLSVTYF